MNAMHYGLLAVLVLLGFYLVSRYGMLKEGYSDACLNCMQFYIGDMDWCWGPKTGNCVPGILKSNSHARARCGGKCG